MNRTVKLAACAALLLGAAACGDDKGAGELSADEARQLNQAAQMLENDTVDASPDSLVVDESEEAMPAEGAEAAAGGANAAEPVAANTQ